jgi:hypothetical protein
MTAGSALVSYYGESWPGSAGTSHHGPAVLRLISRSAVHPSAGNSSRESTAFAGWRRSTALGLRYPRITATTLCLAELQDVVRVDTGVVRLPKSRLRLNLGSQQAPHSIGPALSPPSQR